MSKKMSCEDKESFKGKKGFFAESNIRDPKGGVFIKNKKAEDLMFGGDANC